MPLGPRVADFATGADGRPQRTRGGVPHGGRSQYRREETRHTSRIGRDRTLTITGTTMSQARTSDATPAPHAADRHDLIRVHGARVNNLRDVSI
ncbi:MAG: hypothetical protein EBT09_14805, partial [Actinobacteria bacterium]|nr:hypothetical protein [Actinomycetota bacterium]